MKTYILIFTGGGAGSLLRFFVSRWLNPLMETFPAGTLAANVLSSFILGIVAGLLQERYVDNTWLQPFVIVGICGGFSTFSTFSSETLNLFKNEFYLMAMVNVILSVVLCITFITLGMKIVK